MVEIMKKHGLVAIVQRDGQATIAIIQGPTQEVQDAVNAVKREFDEVSIDYSEFDNLFKAIFILRTEHLGGVFRPGFSGAVDQAYESPPPYSDARKPDTFGRSQSIPLLERLLSLTPVKEGVTLVMLGAAIAPLAATAAGGFTFKDLFSPSASFAGALADSLWKKNLKGPEQAEWQAEPGFDRQQTLTWLQKHRAAESQRRTALEVASTGSDWSGITGRQAKRCQSLGS
ncbi:hypothetical protein DFS34DRAFT_686595 [Phlyctochytrium arcticum]|nr:hypothetical protein DFS34DRAFT_686595 [Phlyctochytrium arcticum]